MREEVQRVKVPATKHDILSLVSGTYLEGGGNLLQQSIFSPHTDAMWMHTHNQELSSICVCMCV